MCTYTYKKPHDSMEWGSEGMAMGWVQDGLSISAFISIVENHTHTSTHTYRVLKTNIHIILIEFCRFVGSNRVHIENEN